MLLDDGKRFSVHSKVEQLFSFALLFLTHILKTDIHFLWKQQGEIAILVEMDRLRTCQHFIFQTLLDCAHWGRIPTVSRSSYVWFVSWFVSVWTPLHHLQVSRFGWLVSVSPGDLGRLSVMGREGVSDDDGVLRRDHPRVPGHRDGREYVVTWNVTDIILYYYISSSVQCSSKLLCPPPILLFCIFNNRFTEWVKSKEQQTSLKMT